MTGYDSKRQMAADKLQEPAQEPVTEREALEIALDYVLRTTYWTEGRDRHDTLKAIKEALAQPESEIKSWGETHPRNPSAACSCEHWQSCVECRPTAHAQPAQEPEYWNVIDPAGNIVASETDAIRGWARIAGSYKPTVEGLLGFHDQGWRVLPKIAPPLPVQPQRKWVGLTDAEIAQGNKESWVTEQAWQSAVWWAEAKLKEKNT